MTNPTKTPICDYIARFLPDLKGIEKGGKFQGMKELRSAVVKVLADHCWTCGGPHSCLASSPWCSSPCADASRGVLPRCEGCASHVEPTSKEWPSFCSTECRARTENECELARTLSEDPVPASEIRMKDRGDWGKA